MIKKHIVVICLFLSLLFIGIASFLYPGGSILNKNSVGFNWTENFISNLFDAKAINGKENPAQFWALIGMAFHSIGFGLFFINTSKKVSVKHTATVLKVIGYANILFTFLIASPLHDSMVILSSTLLLIALFYLTVLLLKTKRHLLKTACIVCLLTFYYTLFLYGSGNWGLLAIMQKVSFIGSMLLVLGLQYFTEKADFVKTTTVSKAEIE